MSKLHDSLDRLVDQRSSSLQRSEPVKYRPEQNKTLTKHTTAAAQIPEPYFHKFMKMAVRNAITRKAIQLVASDLSGKGRSGGIIHKTKTKWHASVRGSGTSGASKALQRGSRGNDQKGGLQGNR